MMRRWTADVWTLAVSAGLLIAALIGTLWGERTVRALHAVPLDFPAGETAPGAAAGGAVAEVAPPWSEPGAGADGESWTFDLFTPPVIYYNRATGRFSVTPPEVAADDAEAVARTPFGVSLLGVEQQPYRLQLVGFAGDAGAEWGIFVNGETSEGIVARAGHVFADLGLEVRTLVVRREDMIVPDSMPLREIVAVAEVWDARDGRLVRLSSAARQWIDAPAARLQIDRTGALQVARAGDRFPAEDAVFEVRTVTLEPAAATVVKRHADGTLESLTLRPVDAAPPASAPDPFAAL